ncbi:family 10 glycosylhydrolase [Actinomycetes bacterium KLBMP 9797]
MTARLARLRAALVATALLGGLAAGTAAPTPASAAPTPTPPSCTTDPASPKRQFRAMWIASVANIDWPSTPGLAAEQIKAEYRGWLDLAQRLNHNAVIVQVRPTADAFWPSPYEPWSEWLTGARTGASPGWDPLAFLVEEAHRRNLEFHAWFNPYRISMPQGAGADIDQLAPNHPVRQHRDWAVAYPANAAGSRLYYNPGIPEVRQFVQTAMMDAVRKYDVDGVHFDDYFYPYPAAGQDFADDATFAQYGAGFASKADWRRHNIDLLVQEFGAKVRAVKPWVRFGVSPFGIWRNKGTDPLGSETTGLQSYDAIYADTRKWVKEEWIDYILPQVYWNIGFAAADYAKLVPWWADVVRGTDVQLYIGQADYKIGEPAQPAAWQDPAEMSRHLTFNRAYPEVAGNVHFSAVRVRANRLGATDIYAAEHYAKPALVPATPGRAPMFPVIKRATRADDGAVRLSWLPLSRNSTSYAIYRLDGVSLPDRCTFADATHLIGTTRGQSFVDTTATPGVRYTYYVTALDRSWNESLPSPPAAVLR